MEYDGLKIYSNNKSKHFSINNLEKIILEKTGINMKLSFKNIEDCFPEFGIRISTNNIKDENIIENKVKIIHHDHAFEKNNILGFICRECNLQIKNDRSIPYEWLTEENLLDKELPSIDKFYSSSKITRYFSKTI